MRNVVQEIDERYHRIRVPTGEIVWAMLLFSSMGAITWAIRGTGGWNGIDGTFVPGLTWGVLWWYVCWRKGIDARGIPLWLGLGVAMGGELGYGQYVSWIRGMFNAGDEVIHIEPWIGYAWFALCGIGWAAPGGIALGWALAGRQSLGVWLVRIVIPFGAAFLTRIAVQTWPALFFPHWDPGLYRPTEIGGVDPDAAAAIQRNMSLMWIAAGLLCVIAWVASRQDSVSVRISGGILIAALVAATALLLPFAQWLFFPGDQLGLFDGPLGRHHGRTVYTNSQNAIVVGWWLGAILVAGIGRDRHTLFSGLVLGLGFGVGFPLAAVWCLGYVHAPNLIDWWKMWELNSGFYLGLLYVVVLYWSIRHRPTPRVDIEDEQTLANTSAYHKWCCTLAATSGAVLLLHVASRENFMLAGLAVASIYVVPMLQAAAGSDRRIVADRQRAVTFVFSVCLFLFIMAWGGTSQLGILCGFYDTTTANQYAWPEARVLLFLPFGTLIFASALFKAQQAVLIPHVGFPEPSAGPLISARIVELMALIGVVGAVSIWPSKIGACYALFLLLALFAFNRLNLAQCAGRAGEI